MASDLPSGKCFCRVLHVDCDPSTCPQAAHSSEYCEPRPLSAFQQQAKDGCLTCAVIVEALNVPQVTACWKASIDVAREHQEAGFIEALLEDETAIHIEIDPPGDINGRRLIRTRASDTSWNWRNFNLWREGSEVSLDSLCNAFRRLHVQPDERTDSDKTFNHLKWWLDRCDRDHACLPHDIPVLPTRVVQVTDGEVKIAITTDDKARYTTLSHRWGTEDILILACSNLEEFTQGIPWNSIPKTFQDAISLTRQLNIDYIWIDCMCIVQDDPQDWARESVKMKSIYGGSYLNIAANSASQSSSGLFTSSKLPQQFPAYTVPSQPNIQIRPQPFFTHNDYGSNYGISQQAPVLLRRGWVLQERLLSPRVVYYDAGEIKWECNAVQDCQCGGIVSVFGFKLDHFASVTRGDSPLPYAWMRIAEKYSEMQLTFDEDRSVALVGIVDQASKFGRGGRYLAGLWEEHLAHQICWYICDTYRKPETYIAPSWSWLSVFGRVWYSNRMDYYQGTVIDVEITEAECVYEDEENNTGHIKSGFIRINGRIVHLKASLVDPGGVDQPPSYNLKHEESGFEMQETEMDYAMTEEDARKIEKLSLLYWGDIDTEEHTFMVLKAVPLREGTFERFGLFYLTTEEDQDDLEKLLNCCKLEGDIIII